MKLIIIRSNLYSGLNSVCRAVTESSHLPILKNILLSAVDGTIKLIATNLELAITATVSGKIIENGKVTVPASVFETLIGNIQTERINIEQKKDHIEVKTDNYEANIQTLPADDFPIIPTIKDKKHHIEISGEIIKTALSQVVPSAQTSDLRPELSSILMSFSLDNLKFVATDSFRLSEKKINKNHFSTNHQEPFKLLIPLKTIQELLRILKNEHSIKIYNDENQILFSCAEFELISRLVNGNFPDYEPLIPKKNETEVSLKKDEFLQALKLTGVFSPRVFEAKLKTNEQKNCLEVFSLDQSLGENNYILPAKVSGTVKEINFNWRFLSDGIKAVTGDQVLIGLNEDNKPALIRGATDASYFYIVMPILKA